MSFSGFFRVLIFFRIFIFCFSRILSGFIFFNFPVFFSRFFNFCFRISFFLEIFLAFHFQVFLRQGGGDLGVGLGGVGGFTHEGGSGGSGG